MTASPYLVLSLIVTLCFTLGTSLQLRALQWGRKDSADSVLSVLLGDGRRLFANHFFIEADVYFHSGYYPSIFDRRDSPKNSPMASGHDEHDEHDGHADHDEEHEKEMSFLGPPRDWIDRFGRRFRITEHTHLHGGQEREILPWLRLSAELDPQRVETYTVAAYWLRNHLGKVDEAETFLREGLRNNPDSYEILFELGRLDYENRHDASGARNLWQRALNRWQAQAPDARTNSVFGKEEITVNLGRLEESEDNFERAIQYLEEAKQVSPQPEALQNQIDEIRQKMAARRSATARPTR